ncbi:MAG: hypothetical protein ACI97A_003056, partial [Planctomycetota bacterium]
MGKNRNQLGARSAETRLFLLDSALSACLALFLTAVSTWENPWIDGSLLVMWALTPQAVARFFRSRPWPKSAAGSFLRCLALVGFAIAVGVTGWQFISASIDLNVGIGLEVTIILLTSWASGFFLFQVQTYRLHDALSFGALSIGLVDGRPDGLLWGVFFVVCFFSAAPIRHQLFDIHAYTARPRLNLRHGGPLIVGTLIFALLVFVGGEAGTRTLLGEQGSGWGEMRTPTDTSREIGWNSILNLSELGRAKKSAEPLFAIKVIDGRTNSAIRPPENKKKNRTLHWRMQVLDQVLNDGSSWRASKKEFRAIINAKTVRYKPSRNYNESARFEVERLSPFNSLVPHIYRTTQVTLLESETPNVSLGRNRRGELAAFGGSRAAAVEGDRFLIGMSKEPFTWGMGDDSDTPNDMHLELPSEEDLGFDIRAEADRVFGVARSLSNKVRHLENYYRESFTYDTETTWAERRRRGDTLLKHFLLDLKVGDCSYFATSACLLLRAAGIPARLAHGFLGMDWDEERNSYVIYEGSAHVWVEYYRPEKGWFWFDGTEFVDSRNVRDAANSDTQDSGSLRNPKDEPKTKNKGILGRLFGNVTDEYNQSRLLMLLIGSIGVIFFLAFLKRPRIAPRRS